MARISYFGGYCVFVTKGFPKSIIQYANLGILPLMALAHQQYSFSFKKIGIQLNTELIAMNAKVKKRDKSRNTRKWWNTLLVYTHFSKHSTIEMYSITTRPATHWHIQVHQHTSLFLTVHCSCYSLFKVNTSLWMQCSPVNSDRWLWSQLSPLYLHSIFKANS